MLASSFCLFGAVFVIVKCRDDTPGVVMMTAIERYASNRAMTEVRLRNRRWAKDITEKGCLRIFKRFIINADDASADPYLSLSARKTRQLKPRLKLQSQDRPRQKLLRTPMANSAGQFYTAGLPQLSRSGAKLCCPLESIHHATATFPLPRQI